jgi:hypothetical protein
MSIVGAMVAQADCPDIYQRVHVSLPFQSAWYGDSAMVLRGLAPFHGWIE